MASICVISSYAYLLHANNYGALFQYYALEKFLEKRGHRSFWLRYTNGNQSSLLLFLKKVRQLRSLNLAIKFFTTNRSFHKFISNNLNTSISAYEYYPELERNPPLADFYFTGSDQVWGGVLQANFLLFIRDRMRKVAYAASFGKDHLTASQISAGVQDWIKTFGFVSIREREGVKLCSNLGVNATWLLDPTLLITPQDYLAIAPTAKPSSSGVLCYFLNVSTLASIYWDDIGIYVSSSNLNMNVVAVQGSEKLFPVHYLRFPSPGEWIKLYNDADSIVTNTFHGTVFAIIFRKPFATILQVGGSADQNSRLISLLDALGLSNRIWTGHNLLSDVLNSPIDWNDVDIRRTHFANDSNEFLQSMGL